MRTESDVSLDLHVHALLFVTRAVCALAGRHRTTWWKSGSSPSFRRVSSFGRGIFGGPFCSECCVPLPLEGQLPPGYLSHYGVIALLWCQCVQGIAGVGVVASPVGHDGWWDLRSLGAVRH
eukprot:9437258-Pyramimonas_sp.AAC.1